jgi:hypothetical protein
MNREGIMKKAVEAYLRYCPTIYQDKRMKTTEYLDDDTHLGFSAV